MTQVLPGTFMCGILAAYLMLKTKDVLFVA